MPGTDSASAPTADAIERAAAALRSARRAAALTGAGVSVESGIPDFRSPDGLWSVYDPMDYATLTCFRREPERAWELYRALGRTIAGKSPNPAHRALAELESAGRLAGVVTQNIDGLHQAAGSRNVLEIHGDSRNLQCLGCDRLEPVRPDQFDRPGVPACEACGAPLKPNVVLFEEPVRATSEIDRLLAGCDVMLVAGTSAEVTPACFYPEAILLRGGSLIEFNLSPTRLTGLGLGPAGVLVPGPVGRTLPLVAARVLGRAPAGPPEADVARGDSA